jgi:hypothetical protein
MRRSALKSICGIVGFYRGAVGIVGILTVLLLFTAPSGSASTFEVSAGLNQDTFEDGEFRDIWTVERDQPEADFDTFSVPNLADKALALRTGEGGEAYHHLSNSIGGFLDDEKTFQAEVRISEKPNNPSFLLMDLPDGETSNDEWVNLYWSAQEGWIKWNARSEEEGKLNDVLVPTAKNQGRYLVYL